VKITKLNSTIVKDLKHDPEQSGKTSKQMTMSADRHDVKIGSLENVLKDATDSDRKTEMEKGTEIQQWNRESGKSFRSFSALSQDRKEWWQPMDGGSSIQYQGEKGTMQDSYTMAKKEKERDNKTWDRFNWEVEETLSDQHHGESKKVNKIKKTKMPADIKNQNSRRLHQKIKKDEEKLKDNSISHQKPRRKTSQKHDELATNKSDQLQIKTQSSADKYQAGKQTEGERLHHRNKETTQQYKVKDGEGTGHHLMEKDGTFTESHLPFLSDGTNTDDVPIKQKRKVKFPGDIDNNVYDQNVKVESNNIVPSIDKQFNSAFTGNNKEKQTPINIGQFVNADHYDQEQNLYIVYPENSLPPNGQDIFTNQNVHSGYQFPLNKAVEEQLKEKTENSGSVGKFNQSIRPGYSGDDASSSSYGDFFSSVPEQGIYIYSTGSKFLDFMDFHCLTTKFVLARE
jgi:hypothetical protein